MLSKVKRFSWSFKKWWWVLLITSGIGLAWSAWQDSKKAPSFVSTARMQVMGRIAMPESATYNEDLNNFYGTQSELMASPQVKKLAAEKVENEKPELPRSPVYVSVEQQRGTSFFILKAIGAEPVYTQAFLDACMSEYIKWKAQTKSFAADTAMMALTGSLNKLDGDVENGERELFTFQKENNVIFLEGEQNGAAKNLVQLNQRLTSLKMARELAQSLDFEQALERKQATGKDSIETNEAETGNDAPMGAEAEFLKGRQQVAILRAERERRSRFMRPKHPIVVKLDAEIAHQERLIELFKEESRVLQTKRLEYMRIEIEHLESTIKSENARALALSEKLAEYDRLKDKVARFKQLSDRLNAGYVSVGGTKDIQPPTVDILDKASPATITKIGQIKDIAIGGVSGLIIGLGIVFLIGLMDDRVTSAGELRERFPEQLLGHIPHEPSKGRVSVLSLGNKQGIFAESYRNLRSTLHFMSLEEPRPKAFLVTSAVPGEGKSTLAVNLAITIAGGGCRTLLVDGDLRKGLLHSYFEARSSPGLIDVLNEAVDWKGAVVETAVKNLFLLPRGKGGVGTTEYFLSAASDRFLRELYAADYDRIIFDSAPVLATDDTACLAPKIDATLFVVRAEASSMRLTRSALDVLEKRQVNLLGLILNAANLRSSEYQYYHKYGDYYAESSVEEKT